MQEVCHRYGGSTEVLEDDLISDNSAPLPSSGPGTGAKPVELISDLPDAHQNSWLGLSC